MATLGQKPATQHVSTEKQTLTGNGGTSYTLQQSVSQAADIEVFVNNTRQEPTVAYTASGTTLTMTGAVNASDSFYVIFQGKAIQTAGLPVDAAITASTMSLSETLSVTGATTLTGGISGNVTVGGTLDVTGNVGLGGANTSSYLQGVVGGKTATIGDESQASSTLVLKDDDGVFDVATTAGTFRIYDDNLERFRIDANGHVTMPYQPAFLASVGSTQTNPANASRVTFSNEIFDQNADYDNSIYVFTAPVTGKYFLSISIRVDSPDTAADYIRCNIATSNRGYNSSIFDLGNLSGDPYYWNMQTAVLADMDAGDTAEVEIIYAGGAAQADISTESYFSGYLVC